MKQKEQSNPSQTLMLVIVSIAIIFLIAISLFFLSAVFMGPGNRADSGKTPVTTH